MKASFMEANEREMAGQHPDDRYSVSMKHWPYLHQYQ